MFDCLFSLFTYEGIFLSLVESSTAIIFNQLAKGAFIKHVQEKSRFFQQNLRPPLLQRSDIFYGSFMNAPKIKAVSTLLS